MCDSFNLRETLNELYNIKPQNIKEIPHGYTNRKYLLTLKNGKKYVARLSPLYREKHIWLESYVLEKLRSYKLGFLVPKVVATLSGEYFRNVGNYILTVFQYIEGSVASELQISPLDKESFSYELGNVVGNLHNAFFKIKIPKTNCTHLELIKSYIDKFNSYFSNLNSEWKHMLFQERDYLIHEIAKYRSYYSNFKIPQSFVHTDIRLDNIILRNDKISAILDFNDVLIGDPAFELAVIFVEVYANHNILSKKLIDFVDVDRFVEFVRGYINTRKIGNKKSFIEHIIHLLNLQALQVLSIVGRDPNFYEEQRIKNVIWYSNFIHVANNENNIIFLKSKMKNLMKNGKN